MYTILVTVLIVIIFIYVFRVLKVDLHVHFA